MLGRKKEGAVVCPSCGLLVGVNDDACYNCGRRNPGLWGFGSVLANLIRGHVDFDQFVIVACAVLFAISLLISVLFAPYQIRMDGFNFLGPSGPASFLLGASGGYPIGTFGRWWTVLSASWLHGSLMHILFNMMWIRQLIPAVQELYGLSRMFIIYTIAGVVGFGMSSMMSNNQTLGASAAVFGLLAAMVYYGRRGGSSMIGQQAKMWAIFLFVFGLIFPAVDNWAHLGGFVGGYASAMWLDPLKPERMDHLIGALACLGLTALAIIFSVIHGYKFMP